MSESLPKEGGIKIECFDVNCKTKYSAKDIEVYMGQRLEKEGYDVNITTPDFLVYLVLINTHCYVGYANYKKLKKKFVNPERHYHPFSKDAVSRSELKLIQAFDDFGIRGKGVAIDLGAAPGGWSHFLAKSGFKVVAIDKGELDCRKLSELGMKVKTITESQAILKKDLKKNNIIHIKANAKKTNVRGIGKATIIVDDMNMVPKESVELVLSFSKNFARNAKLILTVKCVDRNAEKYTANAVQALGKEFKVTGIRVLPSNRQELTLYARYISKAA
jgi:23S rRNA (cytidine2498-2'-O)-methyltransferase